MGASTMSGVPEMTVTHMHGTSLGLTPPSAGWSSHRDENTLMGQDVQQICHTTEMFLVPHCSCLLRQPPRQGLWHEHARDVTSPHPGHDYQGLRLIHNFP